MNIIVIGATSGIGKALFEKYVSEGNRVGIVGRRSHLLEELRQKHPANTVAVTADITKLEETLRQKHPANTVAVTADITKLEETESALKALLTELQDIDLAIVCSGTGDINATLDYAVERPTIDTNVVGRQLHSVIFYDPFVVQLGLAFVDVDGNGVGGLVVHDAGEGIG